MDEYERLWEATRAVAPEFVGLAKADAQQRAADLGLRLRLLDWDELGDDRPVALTADLRADRLTLHVRSGVVTTSEPG